MTPQNVAAPSARVRALSWACRIAALGLVLASGTLAHSAPDAAAAPPQPEPGFVPLFNGKDLTGWSGDPDLWRVENGVLIGDTTQKKIPHNTFLSTDKSYYSDFILRASWKLTNGNSGVQFRSERFPDHVIKGYQADLAEKDYTGMIYEEGKRGIMDYWKALTPEQKAPINAAADMKEWNTYQITCVGHHIKMELNGVVTADLEDPDGALAGVIALQLHAGPGMVVSFKDVFIKDLSPGAVPAPANANADAGFVPLFNGKDLTGWSGDPDLWSVESDGSILGDTTKKPLKHNSFLSTDKTYSDFILRVSWKLENHNSGVQFRSDRLPDHAIKGYQADLAEQEYTGMLYEEGKRGMMAYWQALTPEQRAKINAAGKMKEWNTYVITCVGHHVKMELNGVVTVDIEDPDGASEGVVALQIHEGPGMRVEFKDVMIKDLSPKASASAPAPANADAGFVPLFNDKDLAGWSGDPELWTVETDGSITGDTTKKKLAHNSFLSTEKSYSDFILRATWKLENHNSGVQFRSERFPDHVIKGYQADLAEKDYTGMICEEGKRGIMDYWKALTPEQKAPINAAADMKEWNTYVITCVGHHIKIKLNGVVTVDMDDPDGASEGVVALQLHAGPGMRVHFKDVAIKDLSPKAAASALPAQGGSRVVNGVTVPQLLPDQTARRERVARGNGRFTAPEGFVVEQVASAELVSGAGATSVVNMAFDALGRPALAIENGWILVLNDDNGDGIYDSREVFADQINTALGMCFMGPGDLIVNSMGPNGKAALYRLRDLDGDGKAERIETISGMIGTYGEHGPHGIGLGYDGDLYVEYGNFAHPDAKSDPQSPSRGLQEDQFLPRHLDPTGHSTKIRAPGGTIHRVDLATNAWSQVCGGLRNAFDFDINDMGEIFTFDSDMEQDAGLPWYRAIRLVHAVPGADYGWRTGSGKFPDTYIDTLPPTEEQGRGSPVGVAFYDHDAYPKMYKGALFLGDWSRGRIRAFFGERRGATYVGGSADFVVGEPLNVTDLAVGPDGSLYFSTGGRSSLGGLYRVKYTGTRAPASAPAARPATSAKDPLTTALRQPQHRSAWGRAAILALKKNSEGHGAPACATS